MSQAGGRFTARETITILIVGVCCFFAGHHNVFVGDTIIDRTRVLFGLERLNYNGEQSHQSKSASVDQNSISISPSNPDPWIQEIANLMAEFYQLLETMRYWAEIENPIDYAPHAANYCIDLDITTQYKLEPQVVELLQLLPYISQGARTAWNHGAGDNEFLLSGAFADFRSTGDLLQSRDPLYAGIDHTDDSIGWDDEDGRYMRPHYVPLNQLGNHGVVLILNTKNRHLWVIDQETGDADPGLQDREFKQLRNRNDLDAYASRPAVDVLRDLMQKFIDLEWLPGGICPGSEIYDRYKALYLQHGWSTTSSSTTRTMTSHFDGPAFDQARTSSDESETRQRRAEEPYDTVSRLQFWLQDLRDRPGARRLAQLDEEAASPGFAAQWQDPGYASVYYADRKRQILREMRTEAERKALWEKEIAVAEKEIAALPGDVRRRREERVRRYGY